MVDGVTFLVERTRPVAVLRAADTSVHAGCWADAPLPTSAASPRSHPARGWVRAVHGAGFAAEPLPLTTVTKVLPAPRRAVVGWDEPLAHAPARGSSSTSRHECCGA